MSFYYRIMMKCCCLIVFLFCTIDVSNGGILSGICHSSNGTCGKRDVPCKETFGSEWTYIGKCCNKRPCCKFLKASCVPETCPNGFKLLSNQASSANCYSYHGLDSQLPLPLARDNCATTAGAYLWRPNTEQEANAVKNEFNIPSLQFIWTGGREVNLGTFVFDIDNSGFSIYDQPFGFADADRTTGSCLRIKYINLNTILWLWGENDCTLAALYVCEFPRRVCS